MKKCVIIPAYNEEITIRSVIESIPIDYEVIVVDDGSTDTTAQQVGLTRARLIKHDKNLGYCSAIQSGLKECRSDVVVTIDGDGQHNTEDITRLFQVFESTGADLVIGSRFAGTIRENWYDKIIERLFSALVYITCGKWLSDCSCGLKIFKISLAHLVPFLNKTAGWHQLICVVALKNHLNVVEVPVSVMNRKHGKSKVRKPTKLIFFIFRVINVIVTYLRKCKNGSFME